MRKCAPLAVLAAAAFALAVPVAANAAVAGAIPANSTLAPDLLNATVTTVTASGTTVRYCFSKAIGTTPVFGQFSLRTYRNTRAVATAASASGQCADIVFATVLDATTYTTAGAGGGAVVNSATGTFSNADTTALIGSATNNGTRGRTTAPDLTGVSRSGSNVSYTFDEALAVLPDGTEFSIQDVNNLSTPGLNAAPAPVLSADRKTVTVGFVSAVTVAGAVRATYNAVLGTVLAQSTNDPAPVSSAALPGSNGATTAPDPIQAILVSDGTGAGQIDVVFDQAVLIGAPASYGIVLSDRTILAPTAAAQTNANTIRLTNVALATQGEYVVAVQVTAGAATSVAPDPPGGNSIGTVPAGGNTGAFATGFTTGPDARVMTFDLASNSATITFDQRYAAANSGAFLRVDNTGTVNAASAATLSFGSTTTPGPTTITATFPSLAGTRALQILAGGVTTALVDAGPGFVSSPPRNSNVDQILAPIGSNVG